MQYNLKAKVISLTPAIRAAVEKAMVSLDAKVKRFGESVDGEVEVGKVTRHHKKGDFFRAEIHVRLPGKLVYAASENDDLYVSINAARKEAEKQIASYKGAKTKTAKRLGAAKRR
jgi:ribosomal subunit interface protein